ncbi:hypothetical protein GJ496_006497 [Pomphorhynchus laevis]|nr:hypothetical protein GJ496_006497 [Pomphorhynchus laevis]
MCMTMATSVSVFIVNRRLSALEFHDALCVRYGLQAQGPKKCVCGGDYTTTHALSCKHGGTSILRHDHIRIRN